MIYIPDSGLKNR